MSLGMLAGMIRICSFLSLAGSSRSRWVFSCKQSTVFALTFVFISVFPPAAMGGLCSRVFAAVMGALPSASKKQSLARSLIRGLHEDIAEVKALRDAGAQLHAKNLGDQFVAEMENQDPPPFLQSIGGLEMANPGIREQVETRFLARVEGSISQLKQEDRVALLGWLSQSPLAWSQTGIKISIAEFEPGDPVYDFLGASNEMRNFGGNVARFAISKLAIENTPQAWDHIVAEGASSGRRFGAEQCLLKESKNPMVRSALERRRSELQTQREKLDKETEAAAANDRRHGINPEEFGSYSSSVHSRSLQIDWQREKLEALIRQINPQ